MTVDVLPSRAASSAYARGVPSPVSEPKLIPRGMVIGAVLVALVGSWVGTSTSHAANAGAPLDGSTISTGRRAAVFADGAGLILTVRASCPDGIYGNLRLAARRGGRLLGTGFADITCRGERVATTAAIIGYRPLTGKRIKVRARLQLCPEGCVSRSARSTTLVVGTQEAPHYNGHGLSYRLRMTGEVGPDGAATARVAYTCGEERFGRLDGLLVQTGTRRNAYAAADHTLLCGDRQQIDLHFAAEEPYRPGGAFFVVLGQICTDFATCRFGVAYREVAIESLSEHG